MSFHGSGSRTWIWASILCIVIVGGGILFTKGAPFKWVRSWVRSTLSLAGGPTVSLLPPVRQADTTEVNDIAQCHQEIKRLRTEMSSLIQLKAENETLRQVLDFQKKSDFPHVIATIVSRHDKEGISAVTIDRGNRDGIEQGQAVVDSRGILIGTVIETGFSSATVLDIKDGGSIVSATLAEHDTPLGLLKGKKGSVLSLELIPKEVSVKKDDSVITGGVEKHIPYGIFIGRIDRKEPDENELFQRALVLPSGALDAERFVLVLIQ